MDPLREHIREDRPIVTPLVRQAALDRKPGPVHRIDDPELVEHGVRVGERRLADVVTWKALPFEDDNSRRRIVLLQQDRGRASRRSPANDDGICIFRHGIAANLVASAYELSSILRWARGAGGSEM